MISLVVLADSCGKPDPVDPQGPQVPEEDKVETVSSLANASFEEGREFWTVSGDADAVSFSEQAADGKYCVRLGKSGKGNVILSQSMDNFQDGLYDLVFKFRRSTKGTGVCYVAAGSDESSRKMTSLYPSQGDWSEGRVRGVRISGGKCSTEIRCESADGGWCMIDGLSFVKTEDEFVLLKGGDISELTLVEREGGKYYWDGKQMDCVELLKMGGFNIVRLRLYNDPGNPDHSPSKELPAGVQDEDAILELARRAKEQDMLIELTFHYSDSWTNGASQTIPHEWNGLDFEGLKAEIYSYTKSFLEKMNDQGTLPEYISLGNETQAGLLYPYGYCDNVAQMCALYNSAAKAVRESAPGSKIIIHSDDAGNLSKYTWLFGELRTVDYDIIGASYYPFWTGRKMSEIVTWAKSVHQTFKKPIILMECGYAWHPTLPEGWKGQIQDNGPYNDMTRQGQREFMLEVMGMIKGCPEAGLLGVLYWDPIFIEAGDAGWAVGGDNVVSNTALFDFQGNALEVFDAFMYNN